MENGRDNKVNGADSDNNGSNDDEWHPRNGAEKDFVHVESEVSKRHFSKVAKEISTKITLTM